MWLEQIIFDIKMITTAGSLINEIIFVEYFFILNL